jgi:DNA topoisomerase IB
MAQSKETKEVKKVTTNTLQNINADSLRFFICKNH